MVVFRFMANICRKMVSCPLFFRHGMIASRWLPARLLTLSGLIALGIGVLVLVLLLETRSATWGRAKTANENLLFTVGHVLERTFDAGDRGLRHAVSVLEGGRGIDPVALFAGVPDQGYGIQLVLDDEGRILASSSTPPPGQWTFSDRPYFEVHRERADGGLFLWGPFVSQYDGAASVAFSRRWNRSDGSFGGVVVQTLKLSELQKLFSVFELGPESGINVFLLSGSVLVRFPYTDQFVGQNLAGSPNFERFLREGEGDFVGIASIDGIQRLYVFRTLERYPLIINVAQATKTILGGWQRNAFWLGGLTLILMGACMGLALLAERGMRAHRRASQRLAQAEKELRTIVDSLPVLVAYWDDQLINRMANSAHLHWVGMEPNEIRGRHLKEVIGQAPYAQVKNHFDAGLAGEMHSYERSMVDAAGATRQTVTTLIPDWENGVVKGLFVLVTDISEVKKSEKALFQQKERFRVILESIKDGVITVDAQGKVLYLNPAAEVMTGWSRKEARGRLAEEVMRLKTADGGELSNCPLEDVLERRASDLNKVELILENRDGRRMHIENSAAPIEDENHHVIGAVLVFHDSGPVRARANQMSRLAQHDALTGLPNRRKLNEVGEAALERARENDTKLAVLYLDLDGFKRVNDTHGHAVGDQLLVAVSERMLGQLRAGHALYRLGGDEFVVLIEQLESHERAEQLALWLIESCQAPMIVSGKALRVTVSVGISLCPDHAGTLPQLIQYADQAMYTAKMDGRNRYAWHTPLVHSEQFSEQGARI